MKGVHTVSLVRRPELIDELQTLGANVVLVDTGDPDDMQRQVASAADGASIMVGIDCVAGPATRVIARCLAPGGRVINYGFMTGQDCHMAFQDMFLRDISLEGMNLKNDRSPQEMTVVYERLAGLIARGDLRARIAATYTLEQAQEAIAHQQRTGVARQGKIIIHPNN